MAETISSSNAPQKAVIHDQVTGLQTNGDHKLTHDDNIPVTKVPSLDTVNHYAAEALPGSGYHLSKVLEFTYEADLPTLSNKIIQGYARFISAFTGLEDVAFALFQTANSFHTSETRHKIVCASISKFEREEEGSLRTPHPCNIRECDIKSHGVDTQFALELSIDTPFEDGEHSCISIVGVDVSSMECTRFCFIANR